jgi:hypothetical protein
MFQKFEGNYKDYCLLLCDAMWSDTNISLRC